MRPGSGPTSPRPSPGAAHAYTRLHPIDSMMSEATSRAQVGHEWHRNPVFSGRPDRSRASSQSTSEAWPHACDRPSGRHKNPRIQDHCQRSRSYGATMFHPTARGDPDGPISQSRIVRLNAQGRLSSPDIWSIWAEFNIYEEGNSPRWHDNFASVRSFPVPTPRWKRKSRPCFGHARPFFRSGSAFIRPGCA